MRLILALVLGIGGASPLSAQATLQRAPMAGANTLAPATTLAPPARFGALRINGAQRGQLETARAGRMDFACNGGYCVCRGDLDCNDMFTTNVCGPNAVCIGSYCFCDRSPR